MKRLFILAALLLSACDSGPVLPPVVVLAPAGQESVLAELLAEFTDDSGIPVTISWGTSASHATRLIENTGVPVDVLITDNLADIWRAADHGALRPIQSATLPTLHPSLKDPDGMWAAVDMRLHTISHGKDVEPRASSYDDLGTPGLQGRVCLSSSALPVNRSLIANLIQERGIKETERLVRRWVKNLARPPYPGEGELLDAIREGHCAYGISGLSGSLVGPSDVTPEPRSFDATAVGVGRHAGQPEPAHILVDWLLQYRLIGVARDADLPAGGIAGFRDEEVRLLTERAGYW